MSLQSSITAFGLKTAANVAGETVTYSDGTNTVSLTAVRGSTNWNADAPFAGSRIGERSVDWIIEAATLIDSSGTQIVPDRSHTITTAGGEVFRVMPHGPDSVLWVWSDRDGQTFRRIFTVERS